MIPAEDVKIDMKDVKFSKLFNIAVEVWSIFMTVTRQSKLFCAFLPVLVAIEFLSQLLHFQSNMFVASLIGAVTRKDSPAFYTLMIKLAGIGISRTTLFTCSYFLNEYTSILFRQILTRKLHRRYFRNHNFFKVNCRDPISNPDQRVGSDIKVLSEYLCWLLAKILVTPFTITYYAVQVGLALGWIYPIVTIGYFIIITLFTKILRDPIIPRVCKVRQMEGRFRQQHLDVVENSEKIAFVNGADQAEHRYTERTFDKLLRRSKFVQFLTIPVSFITSLDYYMVFVAAYLVCGTRIFATKSHLSESQLSEEWTKDTFCLVQLGLNCHKYVSIIGYLIYIEAMLRRVAELLNGIDDSCQEINDQGTSDDEPSYSIRNLTIIGPNKKTLIAKLNLDITVGCNILIAGPSNVGKTSLLRVLRKLWTPTEGQVIFTGSNKHVMFLSNSTFFGGACNTLRNTLMYPFEHESTEESSAELLNVINRLHLSQIVKSVDNDLNKSIDDHDLSVLSSGERQRLALARVLLHKPKLVFLDEATNNVDNELVEIFFKECRMRNITTVTVSHNREHLQQFHEKVLLIHMDSTWQLESTAHRLENETT